jgi:hypothetical protein
MTALRVEHALIFVTPRLATATGTRSGVESIDESRPSLDSRPTCTLAQQRL